jgi:hypothetical protein
VTGPQVRPAVRVGLAVHRLQPLVGMGQKFLRIRRVLDLDRGPALGVDVAVHSDPLGLQNGLELSLRARREQTVTAL